MSRISITAIRVVEFSNGGTKLVRFQIKKSKLYKKWFKFDSDNGGDRVKVSDNLGATAVAPVDASLWMIS